MGIRKEIQKVQQKFEEEINRHIDTVFLTYTESGYVETISLTLFLLDMNVEIDLWSSEDDDRKTINGEYEKWETYLKRKLKEVIKPLKKIIKNL